jgi:hypothetical protein
MKRLAVLISLMVVCTLALATPALAAAPTNDSYPGTVIGSLPFSASVDTTAATTDADDTEANTDCGAPATDASVWYELTPASDETIVIDASTSTYPVGVIIVTGSPGSFVFVTCGFFFGGSAPQPEATGGPVVFPATSGQTYAIVAVDPQFDSGGNGGTLNISVEVAPPPPTVALTVDPTGLFDKVTGSATISGTVTCSGQADFTFIDVELTQTVGRFSISGFGETTFVCDGSTQLWTVEIVPFGGLFKGGRATSDSVAVACGTILCGSDEVSRSIRLRA